MDKQQLIDLLKADVVPALGCTEPVCVALSAAHAALQLADEIVSVRVRVNAGIYKNGMSAGIPNCSEVGLNYAAAIGACLKNPERGLELLADLTPSLLEKAAELVKRNAVSVELDEKESGLFVNCTVCTERETCTAQIRGAHTNLVRLEKNGGSGGRTLHTDKHCHCRKRSAYCGRIFHKVAHGFDNIEFF